MSNAAQNRIKSTWTPMSNKDTNIKIYNERRLLINKWFERWNTSQRNKVITDLMNKCTKKQLDFNGIQIDMIRPIKKQDFTQYLPRVLSLYIFSFLDPRSLCRAAQVSWNWKEITELDQLWMPKSLKLGWTLSFSPSPYERGVWKRLYIEKISLLKALVPMNNSRNNELDKQLASSLRITKEQEKMKRNSIESLGRKPWRGSDPNPTDIRRNNYLENDDTIHKINQMRKQLQCGHEAMNMLNKAKGKVNSGLIQNDAPSKIQKNHEIKPKFIENRPKWAKHSAGSPFMALSALADNNIDAGMRPKSIVGSFNINNNLRKSLTRTPRDPPSSKLFPDKPWCIPTGDSDNE